MIHDVKKQDSILFFPTYPVAIGEMMLVARELADRGTPPVFLVTSQSVADAMPAEADWFEVVRMPFERQTGFSPQKISYVQKVKQTIAKLPLMEALYLWRLNKRTLGVMKERVQQAVSRLQKEYAMLEEALDKHSFAAIVSNSLNKTNHYMQPLLKWGREHGLPCIGLPVFMTVQVEGRKPVGVWDAELFSEYIDKYPDKVLLDDKGRAHFKVAPWVLEAMSRLDMVPDRRGLRYGKPPYLFVEGHNAMQTRVDKGISPDRVAVTGMAGLDRLHESFANRDHLRRTVVDNYGLDLDGRIGVFALPAWHAHGYMTYAEEMDYIERIFRALQDVQAQFLVSLHPRMKAADYRFIENLYGVHIAEERLYDLLPAADLFLSSNCSSTLMWAVLCNIPTFGFQDPKFIDEIVHSLPEAFTTSDLSELRDEMGRCCSSPERYDECVKRVQGGASRWALFDGKSVQRIVNTINEITQ